MVRLTGAELIVFVNAPSCDPFPALAHLFFCAAAIFLREAAEITLVGWFPFRTSPAPLSDSITEIA